jgi:hypothetical protein
VDVLEQREGPIVDFKLRELIMAEVNCFCASVGHKSAVGALRSIALPRTNFNLDSRAIGKKKTIGKKKKASQQRFPMPKSFKKELQIVSTNLTAQLNKDVHLAKAKRRRERASKRPRPAPRRRRSGLRAPKK